MYRKRSPFAKRVLSVLLAGSVILSVSSCKKKNVRAERVVKETDPYFLSEEMKLEFPVRSDVPLLKRNLRTVQTLSRYVIVNYNADYAMPADVQQRWDDFSMHFQDYTIEERQEITEIYNEYHENAIAVFHLDGGLCSVIHIEKYDWLNAVAEDSDGHFFLCLNMSGDVAICELFSDGSMGEPQILSDSLFNYPSYTTFIMPDQNHMIFANDRGEMVITDREGNLINHLESIANFYGNVFKLDGKWYVYCDRARSEVEGSPYLQEIDINTGKLSDVRVELTKAAAYTYQYCQSKDGLYIMTASNIAKVDLINGTFETSFSWNDADVGDHRITPEYSYIASSSEFYCVRDDRDHFNDSGYTGPDLVLIHLKKAENNPHAGKSIMIIACNGSDDAISPVLYDRIAEYNRDPEKKARIMIKSYQDVLSDYTVQVEKSDAQIADLVYLDVQSKEGPDILLGFGVCSQFNTDEILLDLNPLIDGSSPLDRGTLFDNVISAAEIDGKLYQIPLIYEVRGLVGNKGYFVNQESCSFEEFDRIIDQLPETVSPLAPTAREDLLRALLSGAMNLFMDYGKKTVQFDTPEFRAILEFVRKYGVDKEEVKDANSASFIPNNERLREGLDAAYYGEVMGIASFGYEAKQLNGEGIFLGVPSSSGSSMMAVERQSVAISKCSLYQDQAWDFIRSLFSQDIQTDLVINELNTVFPVSREALDLCFQKQKKRYDQEAERYKDIPDASVWDSSDYSQEVYDNLLAFLNNIHEYASYDTSAMLIILEEAPGYFTGQRSLDDVVKNIQNRCTTIVNERG